MTCLLSGDNLKDSEFPKTFLTIYSKVACEFIPNSKALQVSVRIRFFFKKLQLFRKK